MNRIALLAPIALAGCHEPVRIALPPVELTECADWPDPVSLPTEQPQRDAMLMDYIGAGRSAWGDCRAKVDGMKAWRETVK